MKKMLAYMLVMLAVLVALSACENGSVPSMVEQRYVAYLEATKTDYQTAVEYTHFENIELKNVMADQILYTTEYDVVEWKQLTDKLWVVKSIIANNLYPSGAEVNHFVGSIDGQYYVMLNVDEIPAELKAELSLEEYKPTGEEYVNPKDVIQ